MKGKFTVEEGLIIKAIPRDEWIRANEIAERTGLTPQVVGLIISHNLLEFIERKISAGNKLFLYKRIN